MEVDEVSGEWVHPVHHGESSSSGNGSGRSIVGGRVPMVQTYSSALGGYHHSSCGGGGASLSSGSSNRVIVHRAKRMRMFYP